MGWLRRQEWSWWEAGLMLGVVSLVAFYTANAPLGTSTTFSRAAGMVVGIFTPEHVAANAYWNKVKPIVDWQFMLVLGIPIGAYLSARLTRGRISFTTKLPEVWVSHFGSRPGLRWTVGLLGGILVGFGARFADGWTSGHGLSGSLQLAVSGFLFMIAMMAAGIITARLVFRRA